MSRPSFSVPQILAWADAFHSRTGEWPQSHTGPITEMLGENWRRVDNALRYGLLGLEGRSSLAQLLQQLRGVRNVQGLPALTEEEVLGWADLHRARTGLWPSMESGPVFDAPGEVWLNVDASLREGNRGLPGGSSLPRLLAEERGVPHRLDVPRLTVEVILGWADEHHARTGRWPQVRTGQVFAAPGETWEAMEAALYYGYRGLPGGSSVAKMLREHRGARTRGRQKRSEKV